MNPTRSLGILAAAALIASTAGPSGGAVAPQGGQSAYVIRLPEFDLFNYRSSVTDLDRAEVETAMSRTNGGIWNVYSWNPQSRTPSEMYGSGIEIAGPLLSPEDVRGAAERTIRANPGTFRADLDGLRFTDAVKAPARTNTPDGVDRPAKWAAHFQQVHAGIDVAGGEVHLTFTDSGRLFAMGSTYYPNISVSVSPTISLDRAKQIARAALPFDPATDSVEPDGKLVILPVPLSETEVEYHLVWRVRVHTQEPLGIWSTDVEARSGAILQRTNDVCFADFYGTAVGQIERTGLCQGLHQEALPYLWTSINGVGSAYADDYGNWRVGYGGTGSGYLTTRLYSPYVDVQNDQGANSQIATWITAGVPYQINFDGTNSRPDERDVYRTINDVHDFFETFAPGFGYTNQRITAHVNVNLTCNAYWDGAIHFYMAGNGCANTGQMMSVVAHEFGHGVQNYLIGGQGGQGLGEGNGDVLGFLITMDSVFARGVWYNCNSGWRDCNNTLQYPGDVIGHEIHDAGRVIAGFHWDAMEDQIARYGDWGRYSTAFDWHWGRALQRPTDQPAQVLATFIANDNDGDLTNGTPQYISYCLAATNHGFSCPTARLPLASGTCDTYHLAPQSYKMTQSTNFWTAVAVNPSPGDDKDMYVYSDDGSILLAQSTGTVGTDFVVGDFNHNPLGPYRPNVTYGNTSTPYIVEWDDGADTIFPGNDVYGDVGGGGGSCGVVRVWDVYLQAGTSYRFYITDTGIGTADIRASLFRNPTAAPYWAGRSAALFELTSGTSTEYTAPATDFYGVAVFNNSPGNPGSSYMLRVQQSPVPLSSGICGAYSPWPKMFSFFQENGYWAGVAVNPIDSDDKDIEVYDNPDGVGSALASSTSTSGTDFIVGDFNHTNMTTYYPRVEYGNVNASYVVEWEDGRDLLTVGTPVNGTVGGGSGGCGLINVWDVYLTAGQTYRFGLQTSGADIRMCLFRNRAGGPYWAGRDASEFEAGGQDGRTYTAPTSDFYGVVVFNNSPDSPSGSYTLWAHSLPTPLADGQCQSGSFIPTMYSFAQSNLYWSAVAVNPSPGDDKDLYVYNNQDGFGSYLASSTGTQGTDFVIGDFNHTTNGTYYALATYGDLTTPYVVDWDDGTDLYQVGQDLQGTIGGGGGGGCGLIKVWDVYLTAGKTYRAYLSKAGSADIRVSLFRNPTAGAYWAGRLNSEFELQAGSPVSYTAPATDYYGLVVFNASAGSPSGTYTLRFQEAPVALASGACQSWPDSPRMFSSAQSTDYWSAVAVDPASGDNKDIVAYSDPDGETAPIATSQLASGTDFIVDDFNHSAVQTFYTRVTSGSPAQSYAVEWDDGADIFPIGTTVNGSVGGGTGDCGVIRVWDLQLQAGNSYQITLTKNGAADIRTAIFYNPASAPYAAGRSAAALDKGAAETPTVYTAPATDYYCLAVFNNSAGSASGTYTIRVDPMGVLLPDLIVEDMQIQPANPTTNDPVQVRALIKNQGSAAAAASTTRFYLDGTARGDKATPALAIGQDAWTDWLALGTLPQGAHTARACADAMNAIQELSENNNCMDKPFTVQNAAGVNGVAAGEPGIHVPNPYSAGSPILVRAAEEGSAAIVSIYDVSGQRIRTLLDEPIGRSVRQLQWDGHAEGGLRLGSGIYFIRARIGSLEVKRTLLLIR